MIKKRLQATLPAMKLAKKVRVFAGLNAWKMHKRMNRKSVQSYLTFERTAKRISLGDYFMLEQIYIEAGGSKERFNELARDCADKD